MKLNTRGIYKRYSSFFEVSLKRSDLYVDVTNKISTALNVKGATHLVRISGAIIREENSDFAGSISSVWTLGRYLNKIHYSPEKSQLGIAPVQEPKPDTEVPESDTEVCLDHVAII